MSLIPFAPFLLLTFQDSPQKPSRLTERKCQIAGALCRAHHFPFFSRSPDAVSRVYDETRNVIETHARIGDFRES